MKKGKTDILQSDPRLKQNPFSVPEGYFEDLSSKVMEKIREVEHEPRQRVGRRFSLRSQIALAASILGIAIISYAFLKVFIVRQPQQDEYVDLNFIEEANLLPEDAYLAEIYAMEDENYEETSWETEAMEYLASNHIEFDLLIEYY